MLRNKQGFTLIELIMVMAIMVILVMIAFGSYQRYMLKNYRTDGTAALIRLQQAEEKYRFNHNSYGNLAAISNADTSPNNRYRLSITNISATSYTLTATAIDGQTQDREGNQSCMNLSITYVNGSMTKQPAECW